MNAHVFIVNEDTFRVHLEYMFAGTGARGKLSPFLSAASISFNASTERNLVGMIADVSRIQIGDSIIFYLQATPKKQGQFFGIFKAKSKVFFDENDSNNYLRKELSKGLSLRILLESSEFGVFPKGITEHEYLDDLEGKEHPYELCWSLIYRKLKGNRGCTMIMDYEFNDLLSKLKQKNDFTYRSKSYTFDATNNEIIPKDGSFIYSGRQNSVSIKDRLHYKSNRGNAFETHLQAYIIQNIESIPLLPLPNADYWIGNEVSCGVGMQRIDVLIKQEDEETVYFKLIELKDELPTQSIVDYQLNRYLKWLFDYVVPNYPNRNVKITPCIIAKESNNHLLLKYISDKSFHIPCKGITVNRIEYISFAIGDRDIQFKKIL